MQTRQPVSPIRIVALIVNNPNGISSSSLLGKRSIAVNPNEVTSEAVMLTKGFATFEGVVSRAAFGVRRIPPLSISNSSPPFSLPHRHCSLTRADSDPMLKVTYYLEVLSSWCFWAEPAWAELKQRYAGRVEFDWKIAQMPPEAYPVSKSQCDWFYRRSGSVMRSPFMLNSGWFEPDIKQYLVPNYVAQAAKDLGVTDDRVRLAIARAALREGKKLGRYEVAVPVASEAGGLDAAKLDARAHSPETVAHVQATTAEFHALQVNQRPTFLIQSPIGDRIVFSGIVRQEPLSAAIDAALSDEAAYASWKTHFGDVPSS